MREGLAVAIRSYHPRDAAGCRACVVELQDAERQIDPRLRHGESMADEYLAQMHERCRRHSGALFVAAQTGEIVGLVMVLGRVAFETLDDPPGEYALVAELVVRDGFRRQGIAQALLDAAEGYAREKGASELQIVVLSRNDAARALYERRGFVPYKETRTKPLSS